MRCKRYSSTAWNIADQGGKLQRIFSQKPAPNAITHQDLNYIYDKNGNIVTINDYKNGSPFQHQFTYDNLDRLYTAVATNGGASKDYSEGYTYNSTTGNLATKAGVTYTYGSAAHKHAVTALSNGNTYQYDANGNMTQRYANQQTYNFGYDAENHLTAVTGAAQAQFKYNGDGQRVVATEGITTTVFVGNYFELQFVNGVSTQVSKYYYSGSTRVAMQRGGQGVKYLLGDHLGSASVVLNADGTSLGAQGYKPWGSVNFTEGTIPTEYTFTGQFSYVSRFGMAYFNARWYLPELGRFSQPDTIIPENQGVQAFDRFAYANNNAIKYTDPSGHQICPDIGYCGRDTRGAGSLAKVLYEDEDWDNFEKLFGLRLDSRLSETAKLAIYAAVFAVAIALANATLAPDLPEEIFGKVFGKLSFDVVDVDQWGYAAGRGADGYNHIQLDPTINWDDSHIVNFVVHEMGHIFAQNINSILMKKKIWGRSPYSELATKYARDPNFPARPDGFAGDGWEWSDNSGRDGASDEFADMFLGWVFGEWASNDAGTTRAEWMNEKMVWWLAQVH